MPLFRRPALIDPRTVPTVPVEVDWTHPLADGLVALWVPGGTQGLQDLCGNADLVPAGGTISTGPYGPQLTCNGTITAPYAALSAPLQVQQGTMFWAGEFTATPTGDVNIIGAAWSNPGGTPSYPYTTVQLYRQAAGDLSR